MAVGAGRIFAINLLANSKPAEDAFKKVGQAAGRIPTPMKVAAAAITAVFAVVTTVAVKSFRALLELGEEFNEVTRIIRVGTGAVGGDLAALEQSFRNVASAAPNAFADIASVVAELDTRTDLAGDALEEMSTQLLTLSRLMGGDARQTTREVTRLFNRFGLEAGEASKMLDVLFRAAQASGASVEQLSSEVTKNAGALLGMGFSLEESIAMFALFEREGVRSEVVVRALRSSFQRLTADGRPLRESLNDVFEELKSLDREAAIAKGLEIFGSQALELVDAVRDGRLSVEDFTKQIVDGEDTIKGVAEDTDGWREALDRLRNNLKLQFEPLAREVFASVTTFIEDLLPAVQRVQDAFEEDGLAGALAQVAIEWNKIYEEQLKPLWFRFLDFLNDTVRPIAIELGKAIGGAIASGIADSVRNALRDRFFGQGKSFFSDEERALLEGSMPSLPGLGRDLGLPAMGGAPAGPSVPQTRDPAPRPAPRPSPSSAPAGSGGQGRPSVPELPPGLQFGSGGLPFIPFANGGIVTSPVLGLVGEAGPEAIIPLDRAGNLGTNIVVNVSGAIDPESTARQIRRLLQDAERRTGVTL